MSRWILVAVLLGAGAYLGYDRWQRHATGEEQHAHDARVASVEASADRFGDAFFTFWRDMGRDPHTLEELVKAPASDAEGRWKGPYVDSLQDPWGNSWQTKPLRPGWKIFPLMSYGADGREGGEGRAADLSIVVAPYERKMLHASRQQALRGSVDAQLELALRLLDQGGDAVEEGMQWLSKAAEAGDPRAQYTLGKRLLEGNGVSSDVELGRSWLQKAAAGGMPGAQELLEGR